MQTAVRSNNLLTGDIDWIAPNEAEEDMEQYPLLKELYQHIVENYDTLYEYEERLSVSPAVLSYRLAEFLPFDNNIKQEILETDKANDRLELINTNLMSMEIEFDTSGTSMQ